MPDHRLPVHVVRALYQRARTTMRAELVSTLGLREKAGSALGVFLSTSSAKVNGRFSSSSALRRFLQLPPRVQFSTFLCTKFPHPALSKAQRSSSIAPLKMSINNAGITAGKQAVLMTDAAQLIDSVETFIFDCDGVIWNADKLLDGVKETIDLLRSKGKRLYFLTNNSTKSRRNYVKKAESFGLAIKEEEMFSSGFATVLYLQSINFPSNKKVYMICESGLGEEFEQAGISYIGGSDDDGKKVDFKPDNFVEHDHDVGAVVVGFDRNINYYKMHYAALCLRANPGCIFIATNCDEVIMPTGVQGWPGESAMVGAIRGTTKKEPIVVGKPSTFMMDYLCDRFNIKADRTCMVGDNLETDILFGKNGRCKTLLVLTGVTDLDTLQSPENSIQPDYYTHQLSDLLTETKSTAQVGV